MLRRPRLRSQSGCLVCRRRRVKCDEIRPMCSTCARLRLRCFWSTDERNNVTNPSVRHTNPAFIFCMKGGPEDTNPQPILNSTVNLSPFRDQICAAYMISSCFKESNSPFNPVDTEDNGFTVRATLTFAPIEDSLAWGAVFAHSLWIVGQKRRDSKLIKEGMLRHGKLMEDVRTAITDKSNWLNYDLLAAINNIGMFSVIRGGYRQYGAPDENSDHTAGLQALMEQMQPHRFQGPRALAFLEYIRYGTLTSSLLFKRPNLLASEAWKTIPWTQSKHGKGDMQRLLDLVGDIVHLQPILYIMDVKPMPGSWLQSFQIRKHIGNLLFGLHSWRHSVETKVLSKLAPAPGITRLELRCKDPNLLYELGIFNMILIYMCRITSTDDMLRHEANMSAYNDATASESEPAYQPETLLAPSVLPLLDCDARARTAAREVATIWNGVAERGLTASSCIYLTVPVHVALEQLASVSDPFCAHLNKALNQISSFWSQGA